MSSPIVPSPSSPVTPVQTEASINQSHEQVSSKDTISQAPSLTSNQPTNPLPPPKEKLSLHEALMYINDTISTGRTLASQAEAANYINSAANLAAQKESIALTTQRIQENKSTVQELQNSIAIIEGSKTDDKDQKKANEAAIKELEKQIESLEAQIAQDMSLLQDAELQWTVLMGLSKSHIVSTEEEQKPIDKLHAKLTQQLLTEFLQETELSSIKEKFDKKLSDLIEQLQQILCREALADSVKAIGSDLAKLPKNDPKFLQQYASSFANQTLALTADPAIQKIAEDLINNFPDFNSLSKDKKMALATKLTTVINLESFVVAGKLLEANGVKGNQFEGFKHVQGLNLDEIDFSSAINKLNEPANAIMNAILADKKISANNLIQG